MPLNPKDNGHVIKASQLFKTPWMPKASGAVEKERQTFSELQWWSSEKLDILEAQEGWLFY